MKRAFSSSVVLLVLVSLLLASIGCAQPAPSAPASTSASTSGAAFKPMTLKVASPWIETNPNNQTFGYAFKLITERTGGAVKFEGFYGGSLGKPEEHLDLLTNNTMDIALTNQMYTINKTPIAQFEYSIPFPPANAELVYRAKKKLVSEFPAFQDNLAKYNARWLLNIPVPPYQFLSKTPINGLADLKGKKIGVVGKYFGKWMEPAGLVPVVSPMPERYQQLQTGLIDIDLLFSTEQFQMKHHEQAKYAVQVGIGTFVPVDFLINLKTWNSFTPELQKVFTTALDESAERLVKTVQPEDIKKADEAMKAAGVTFTQFPEGAKAEWAAKLPDTAAEFAAEAEGLGYPGSQIIKRYQDIMEEMGYKWPRRWGVKP